MFIYKNIWSLLALNSEDSCASLLRRCRFKLFQEATVRFEQSGFLSLTLSGKVESTPHVHFWQQR